MNGIATALDNTNTNWIFVLACDMPLVKKNIINYLYDNIDLGKQAVIHIFNDKLQPLCGFYNKSILDEINQSIINKEYSLFKLLYKMDIAKIAIPINMKKQFLNINFSEDIKKLKSFIS